MSEDEDQDIAAAFDVVFNDIDDDPSTENAATPLESDVLTECEDCGESFVLDDLELPTPASELDCTDGFAGYCPECGGECYEY